MRTYPARLGALALLAASTLLPSLSRADDATTRKAIEKQYAKIGQAYKTKNIKPIQDVSTPDYTLTAPTGQIATRQQMEQQFGTAISFIQSITSAGTKISKISVKGNGATVDALETVNGIVADPQTQGKTHTLGLSNQYRDTWVKSGSTWLRKHSDLLKSMVITDGQKQDLSTMMGGGAGAPRK